MAMKLGGGDSADFSESGDAPIMAEINVTPLVDIFLLLLVIFMVTSSVISQSSIPVNLPQSSQAANSAEPSSTVIVTVNAGAEIFVNAVRVPREDLGDALKVALEKSADKVVILEGDREAVLGTIVEVMDIGRKAGALKFAVATKADK